MKYILSIAAIIALAGCASVVNTNAEGNLAFASRQFDQASLKYMEALDMSSKDGDKQYQAIAMYGLARTNAQKCNVSDAEKWFRDSIALRETLPDDRSAMLTQNLVEFSRFLRAQNRNADAIPFIERAIPLLEGLSIEQSDPMAYARFLDEYAQALMAVGRADDAARISDRVSNLRVKYADRPERFVPDVYPTNCKTSG